MTDYLPESDALLFHLIDGGELEISFVILDGEEIYHEQNADMLSDALVEVLAHIDTSSNQKL